MAKTALLFMRRPIDHWSGQGQGLMRVFELIDPLLDDWDFVLSSDERELAHADAAIFWDMQEYCELASKAPAHHIVRIGGLQPPDFMTGYPLPPRLNALLGAPVVVGSGTTLSALISRILGRRVVPIRHRVDVATCIPRKDRAKGKNIVMVANDVEYYRPEILKQIQGPVQLLGYFPNGEGTHVPPERMKEIYQDAAVFVRLTTFEGSCLSRAESLACGVPQLSTSVGDTHYQVSDNGYVMSQEQADDITIVQRFVNRFLEMDRDAWLDMSAKSRLIAIRFHAPFVIAGLWEDVLNQC